MKLHLVSLGCAKNLVDSEIMLSRLINVGWTFANKPEQADVIIVNTCSFIESAINESIDTIIELSHFKQIGTCQRLIVTGCLPERFGNQIVKALPEVDIFLGTGAFDKIVNAANSSKNLAKCFLPNPNLIKQKYAPRILSCAHTAYIKIAEGCDRRCAYCIIPKLKGKYRSRLIGDIVDEAHFLIRSGVKEIALVAQETTIYGKDLFPSVDLSELMQKIAGISNETRFRILYCHPESINESTIKTIANHKNICSYFDIPIQHASNSVLKKMKRKYTREKLYELFDKIRSIAPDATLRTTAIVGFPEETNKDFNQLLDFIEDIRFDHVGVFVYSDSDDIASHKLPNHVPNKTAKKRHDILMSHQAKISLKNNRKHIGKIYDALVENKIKDNVFSSRTFFQAPEIDGVTYIHSKSLEIGNFARVKITNAFEYDLIGKCI